MLWVVICFALLVALYGSGNDNVACYPRDTILSRTSAVSFEIELLHNVLFVVILIQKSSAHAEGFNLGACPNARSQHMLFFVSQNIFSVITVSLYDHVPLPMTALPRF